MGIAMITLSGAQLKFTNWLTT